tara:strand:+ start:297 stop:863 length:567 start_codon:yes stop_codon:yes gene_type:complete
MKRLYDMFIYNDVNKYASCDVMKNTPVAIFYRLSGFFYTILGILVFVLLKDFKKYDPNFPWFAYACMEFFHGFLIYKSDVMNFGKKDELIKMTDRVYSFVGMFITWIIISFRGFLGYSKFPVIYPLIHFIFGFIAMYAKYRSTKELRDSSKKMSCDEYLFWHGFWHCYPLFGCCYILIMFSKIEWNLL